MTITTNSSVIWTETPANRRYTRRIVPADQFARAAHSDSKTAHNTLMSERAPIARALLGRQVGDVVTVETGVGRKTIAVLEVRP